MQKWWCTFWCKGQGMSDERELVTEVGLSSFFSSSSSAVLVAMGVCRLKLSSVNDVIGAHFFFFSFRIPAGILQPT